MSQDLRDKLHSIRQQLIRTVEVDDFVEALIDDVVALREVLAVYAEPGTLDHSMGALADKAVQASDARMKKLIGGDI